MDLNEREYRFLHLESDGTLKVEMEGTPRALQPFGVVVPQPPRPLYMDIVGKRIQKQHKPLR